MQVPDPEENTVLEGFIMFCSFVIFGAAPLIGYAVFPFVIPGLSSGALFGIACAITGATLFALGAVKVVRLALICIVFFAVISI